MPNVTGLAANVRLPYLSAVVAVDWPLVVPELGGEVRTASTATPITANGKPKRARKTSASALLLAPVDQRVPPARAAAVDVAVTPRCARVPAVDYGDGCQAAAN